MEPVYRKLSSRIEDEIRRGAFRGGRLPGIHTLARRLGANHITVRKALELLAEKGILEVIPSRGTFLRGTSEPRKRYGVIGCVGSYFSAPVRDLALEQANERLEKDGYSLLNITSTPTLFDENPRLLLQFPVDGYIFFGSSISRKICDCLLENHIPVICTNNRNFSVNHVGSDHFAAYTEILKALKSAGCRKIGFLDYRRPPDFENYIEDIRSVFRRELADDFDPDLFCVSDSRKLYLLHGEGYHEAAATDFARAHRDNAPDGIVAVPQTVPFLKRFFPNLKAAAFSPRSSCPGCDFVMYQELRPLLDAALDRMLELLSGDTSVTETVLPMVLLSGNDIIPLHPAATEENV